MKKKKEKVKEKPKKKVKEEKKEENIKEIKRKNLEGFSRELGALLEKYDVKLNADARVVIINN